MAKIRRSSRIDFLVDLHGADLGGKRSAGAAGHDDAGHEGTQAPVKVAVLPLSRNENLSPKAKELAATLRRHRNIEFDDAGAISRRYRRQDEIGTPFCVTVDFDTLQGQAVTVRERDSMRQERVSLDKVVAWLSPRLVGC